jgi:hypothetical protein
MSTLPIAAQALGHAGLVGNHEDAVADVIERLYALDRGRCKNEVRDAVGVAAIDIDHSVPIEKRRRSNLNALPRRGSHCSDIG